MEIINLDMTPSTVTPNVHAGQYDSARTVRFMLKNGGVPFTLAGTETITAEITRSDNTEATVNVENTSSNYVDVVFDDTVCTVKGLYACELRIKDGDVDIGSKNFALLVQRDPYDGAGVHVVTVGPADICTFETTLPEPLQSVLVNVVATGGNGTPDSPIPINGYTEANITRCGVNLFDKTTVVSGYIDDADGVLKSTSSMTYKSSDYISIKAGENYYIKTEQTGALWGAWYDVNKAYISGLTAYKNTVKTAPSNAVYMRLTVKGSQAEEGNIDTFAVNYPSSDHDYHPYTGNTYTIAFGQTIYGGVLDVTRGKLKLLDAEIDISTLNDITYGNGFFRTSALASIIKKPASQLTAVNALCSIYNNVSWQAAGDNDYEFAVNAVNGELIIKDSRYSDVPSFLAGVSGVPLVYELDTPFDIDLTPEVISAVVGTNNVFADCGQTTVKYLKAE